MSRTTRTASALAVALSLAGAWGCGEDEPAYCGDRDALEESIDGLAEVDVRADGIDALQTQLQDVQTDASALVDATRSEFGPEADQLKTAVSSLGTAVERAGESPSADTLTGIATALSGVQTAFSQLSDAVGDGC